MNHITAVKNDRPLFEAIHQIAVMRDHNDRRPEIMVDLFNKTDFGRQAFLEIWQA